MPQATSYLLPQSATRVLIGQRQLLQKWVEGRANKGVIPDHAGQWGLFGGLGTVQDMAALALQLFRLQTGIDLGDPTVAKRYAVSGQQLQSLQDNDYNPFWLLNVGMSDAGLDSLVQDINANIASFALQEGTYAKAQANDTRKAQNQLGPVVQPQDKWRGYLIANYYNGVTPGQLNTEIDSLCRELGTRSSESDAWYRLSLQQAGSTPPPPPQQVKIDALNVTGAEKNRAGIAYQFYDPGQYLTVQAVTDVAEPPPDLPIKWQGGIPHPSGIDLLRAVPLDTITPYQQPLTIRATLHDSDKSVQVMVVPYLLQLDIIGAESFGDGQWGVDPELAEKVVVRALVAPDKREAYAYLRWEGGEENPKSRLDSRLIESAALYGTDKTLPVSVEVMVD